jgi:drug/metabolite transporter (DMT)-like permease
MNPERGNGWIHFLLVLLVLSWGAAYPIVKYLLRWLSPLELVLARFWIFLPLLVFMLVRWRRSIAQQLRMHPWRSLALALLGVPGYHIMLNLGTRALMADPESAGSAAMMSSILVGSVPAWTALFARLAGQENLSKLQWLGQALCMAGVVALATRGDLTSLHFSMGALLVLGAPLSWGLYSVVAKRVFDSADSSLPITVFILAAGTVITSFFTPPPIFGHLAEMPPGAWTALAFIGLVSTLAGYLIWSVAVRRLGANRPSVYIYFIPVASLAMSALTLGERLGPSTAMGGVLILTGVFLIRRRKA